MKKRVVMVTYKEFEDFEYEKYGGEIFEKYFDVEVWNVSRIFFGNRVTTKNLYLKQKAVNTVKEFIRQLSQYNRKDTFLLFYFPSKQRESFYIAVIVSVMGFQYSMTYCQPYLSKWNTESLKEYWLERKTDYVNALLNALFPPVYNFLAAPASYKELPSLWSVRRQNNILLHTLDYDKYLRINDERNRLIEDKYILFVDESYVAHYDYQILNVASPFKSPEDYYAPMRKFFDFVEEIFGNRIVIAEHPRAYYQNSEIYGNREMIRGQTARLIRDAEMVLSHTSTAIDYIILFQKKFMVIYLDEITRFYEWEAYYIPLFQYLRIKGLNLSKPYDEKQIKGMIYSGSSARCSKYKQNYIKAKGTRQDYFFETVSQYILNSKLFYRWWKRNGRDQKSENKNKVSSCRW